MPDKNLQLLQRRESRLTRQFREDVLLGLAGAQKQLPCKYFYDQRGSQLFDRICTLDDYYLTDAELTITRQYADQIAGQIGPNCQLIEYGSGSGIKTEILLDCLIDPAAYVPVDISNKHLKKTAARLSRKYPDLQIRPVCVDFARSFRVPECDCRVGRRVIYFPGSTIGNFVTDQAQRLLTSMASVCGSGGGLVIGADLKKDVAILEAAYNDGPGVTAQFNLNLLHRINRELSADFQLDQFRHRAVYNAVESRIEMYLVSRCSQTVTVGERRFEFHSGETICTEYSHKYDIESFRALASGAGWRVEHVWTDPKHLFSVQYLVAR